MMSGLSLNKHQMKGFIQMANRAQELQELDDTRKYLNNSITEAVRLFGEDSKEVVTAKIVLKHLDELIAEQASLSAFLQTIVCLEPKKIQQRKMQA